MSDLFNCGRHEYMGTQQCPTCAAEVEKVRASVRQHDALTGVVRGDQPEIGPYVAANELVKKRPRGAAAMEQLKQQLIDIKRKTARFTVIVMIANLLIYTALLLWSRFDVDKTNKTYTNSFQFQCVAWICMYMYGYFMRCEVKQDVGLAMGHDSVNLMEKMDTGMEERFERFDNLLKQAEDFAEAAKNGDHPVIKRFEEKADKFLQELRYIRFEIRKTSGRREELDSAMADGEAVAALIRGETVPCGRCGANLELSQPEGQSPDAVCKHCGETGGA